MRNFPAAALILACLFAQAVPAAPVALVADRLIDGTADRAHSDTVVVVEGERIVAVGDRSVIPDGAEIVELGGMTLMPGMINGHDHPQSWSHDYQNAHLQSSSAYKTLRSLATLQKWLLAGWTSVRVVGDMDVHYGDIDLRRAIEEGHFVAPG